MSITKTCGNCLIEKDINLFGPDKRKKDGKRWECKECRKRDYYLNHQKMLEQRRNDYRKHKDKRSLFCKEYYKKNKEKIKQRTNDYYYENINEVTKTIHEYRTSERGKEKKRNYYHNIEKLDPQIMLARRIRGRIMSAIKEINSTKSAHSLELLGCSIEKFKIYFESLFTEGMTWDLFLSGAIECDHKIPCCAHDLTKEEEQRKCFHYTNLQPLWAPDNAAKASKDKLLKYIHPAPIENTLPNIIPIIDNSCNL